MVSTSKLTSYYKVFILRSTIIIFPSVINEISNWASEKETYSEKIETEQISKFV